MGDVLLTASQVKAWRDEREALTARLTYLDARLNAASIFMEDVETAGEPDTDARPRSSDEAQPLSLVDGIVRVLADAAPRRLSNDEIKAALPSVGLSVDQMHRNYYYTATKRLADRGIVEKHEDGSYSLPSNEKTPMGANPPASVSSDAPPMTLDGHGASEPQRKEAEWFGTPSG